MDLYERLKIIYSQIDKIWLFYYENILGHRLLLLERASHPWLGTRPIINKGTCPGFLLISLILVQVFLLTGTVYPESSSNKSVSSIYIYARTLRVPLDSPNGYNGMQEALNAEGKRGPIFKKIGHGEFYNAYGNKGSGLVVKVQLPLQDMDKRFMKRFFVQDTYTRSLKIAQQRLGGMAPLTVELKGVLLKTVEESKLYDNLIVQTDYFDENDILSNKLTRLISENTKSSIDEAKALINNYVKFLKESWRRGVFIGDPFFNNFGIKKDGELFLMDLNFLEDNENAEDFDKIIQKFCSIMGKNLYSFSQYSNKEVLLYFLMKVKDIMYLEYLEKVGDFSFDRYEFDGLWKKGAGVPMFVSEKDKKDTEIMLRNIISTGSGSEIIGELSETGIMYSIEQMIQGSGRMGLIEKLPYIERLYYYVRQSYEKDGLIKKGYHRFSHNMETTRLVSESALASDEEFTDQLIYEAILAGIQHDWVLGRDVDDFPKVPDTIELIQNMDEEKQKEIFGATWEKMGVDISHIIAYIARTDYGDKPEDAKRIEKAYAEALEKIDINIREKVNKLAIMLHDADLLATYLLLTPEEVEERIRDLAYEKHLDADTLVSGTPSFIENVVMPAFKRLPQVIQDKYQAQLDAVKEHFEKAGVDLEAKKVERAKEIADLIISLVKSDIEILRDPNKLCGWVAYYSFSLEKCNPYKVLEIILEKAGQSEFIDVYKEALKIKISNAEEDWKAINTEGSEDLINSLRPFDEKQAIKLSDVVLGSLGHGVENTTHEGELDDLIEAVKIVNDYVKEGRIMGSEKIPSPFKAHGAEIQIGESKNISLGEYKFIIDAFDDRIIMKSTEEDPWKFYVAVKALIKKSEPRGIDMVKNPSGILKIDGREYSFYTKEKSIILRPLHEIMRIHRSVARNLMVYTEFGQIIKVEAGEYRIPYDAFRDFLNYPSPDETAELMDRYFEWLKEEEIKIERNMSGALHPVELAAQAFCRLMWIHPFENGNTRTAFLVMNYILMKNNYPPFVLTESNQGEFFKVLRFMRVPFKLDVLEGKFISVIDSTKIFSFAPEDFTAFLASQIKQMSITETKLIDKLPGRAVLSGV